MTAFYCTMFLENILLLSISTFFDNQPVAPWYSSLVLYLVVGCFFFGMFFMWLYYRFFHIRHLKYSLESVDIETNDRFNNPFPKELNQNFSENELCNHGSKNLGQTPKVASLKASSLLSRFFNAFRYQLFSNCYNVSDEQYKSATVNRYRTHFNNETIPGVFNCRLNPGLKRKKKKPSTIPPPPLSAECAIISNNQNELVNNVNADERSKLETISESVINSTNAPNNHFSCTVNNNKISNALRTSQYRRNQTQRPSTNTSILARQMRQSSADTFWRKSGLSARSLSTSPAAMHKFENAFRLPAKHPFSSTITTPTSPVNFVPTENFTDRLCLEQNKLNTNVEVGPRQIIRPKPIVQNSIDLKSLDSMNQLNFVDNNYVNESNKDSSQLASKRNGLFQYYYHPYTRKLKIRSQTPEVLLVPHSEHSCVFYDYPSTVVSMQQNTGNYQNWKDDFFQQFSNDCKIEDEDEIFTRQCQRPPVPGREGDEKSEENDDNNGSYTDGKRSLIGHGLNRFRLEKILENKKSELELHKLRTSQTNEYKCKRSRYHMAIKKKRKYSSNSKLKPSNNKRSSLRVITQNSSEFSVSYSSHSSSGDEGDIESDINQYEKSVLTRPSMLRTARLGEVIINKPQNVYDQVHQSDDDHPHHAHDSSGDDDSQNNETNATFSIVTKLAEQDKNQTKRISINTDAVGHGRGPVTGSSSSSSINSSSCSNNNHLIPMLRIIRGPAHHITASHHDGRNTVGDQKINNYHLASKVNKTINHQQASKPTNFIQIPKPLYHSAKYKRHNTPL